ncbi:unnamed protein product [Hydatigera taeniaeformis]|uniref:CDT1 domain-containing protein n=1 Tax=Hydatigena taeniaeformis TaxID=6205 RepID=A0A0R3WIS2_HYDTA|nr:unnamed protein product [Hydatigera taeniaeformis]
MSSRLTSYFGVRRACTPSSSKTTNGFENAKSNVFKAASADSNPIRSAPTSSASTESQKKDRRINALNKIKGTHVTRTRNRFNRAKLPPKKLPAYMRFVYLARKEDLKSAISPKLAPSCKGDIAVGKETREHTGTGMSTDLAESRFSSVKDENLGASQTRADSEEQVVSRGLSQSSDVPEVALKNFVISIQKRSEDRLKLHVPKEIQALTESGNCSNVSVEETSTCFEKDNTAIERVETSVVPGFSFPSDLHLPHHMERLLELFRTCESLVSTLHNRSEVCSFDKIKPAVQEVVSLLIGFSRLLSDFTEVTVGKFSAVYPLAYSFRYDKQLDRITKRPLSTYTLVLVPNLRTDGTQMAYESPSKGHLAFTGTRLIQRRHIFHNSLLQRVKKAHREFLMGRFGLSEDDLPEDSSLRRWHPAFALDTVVPEVEPIPLPPRPPNSTGDDDKITSASEAVAAFRTRALFREAKACENLVPKGVTDQKFAPPTPTTATADPNRTSNSAALRGVSAALLAKVRERERQLNLSILAQPVVSASERAAYSALPVTITQIWRELRGASRRPVPTSLIATRLIQSSASGLSLDEAMARIENLLTLMPDWVEKVAWARPHLRFKGGSADRPLKEVIDEAKAKASTMSLS